VIEGYVLAGLIVNPELLPIAKELHERAFSKPARPFLAALIFNKEIKHVEPDAEPLVGFIVELLEWDRDYGTSMLRENSTRHLLSVLAKPFLALDIAEALRHAANAIEKGRNPEREIRDALALASEFGVWGGYAA